jgi:L-arabinonolactonase
VRDDLHILGTDDRDVLGEGPWWLAATSQLLHVDIVGRRLIACNLDGANQIHWTLPSEVGFAVGTIDVQYAIVGLSTGLALVSLTTGVVTPYVDMDLPADLRVNDGSSDRAGRLWFGTMHVPERHPYGALYRLDEARPRLMLSGITTSNGLGWSPDDKTFYYTDSRAETIWSFGYDIDQGIIMNRRDFMTEGTGIPDGLTVDSEGAVWSARWDGGMVMRYSPDGRELRRLMLPVARPTSCAFAGARLDTLVITSAQGGDSLRPELEGSMFLIDVGVTGLPETPASTTGS